MSTNSVLSSEARAVLLSLCKSSKGERLGLGASSRVLARAELVPAGLAIESRGETHPRYRFEATDAGRELATHGMSPEEVVRLDLVPPEAGPVGGETEPSPPPAADVERVHHMVREAQARLVRGAELVAKARETLELVPVEVTADQHVKDAIGFTLDALELFLSPLLASESMLATFEPTGDKS